MVVGGRGPGELPPVGPCITGIIDLREQPVLEHGMVIEEGVIPGGLSTVLARVFPLTAVLIGDDTDGGLPDFYDERKRETEALLAGGYRGALANTTHFLVTP